MEWNARKQGNALSNDWNGTQVTNGAPYVINRIECKKHNSVARRQTAAARRKN